MFNLALSESSSGLSVDIDSSLALLVSAMASVDCGTSPKELSNCFSLPNGTIERVSSTDGVALVDESVGEGAVVLSDERRGVRFGSSNS